MVLETGNINDTMPRGTRDTMVQEIYDTMRKSFLFANERNYTFVRPSACQPKRAFFYRPAQSGRDQFF